MDGTTSEAGSESPSSRRFKVISPPAANSPLGSAKMNHVSGNSATLSASSTPPPPPPPAPNGKLAEEDLEAVTTVMPTDEEKTSMEPREPIVRSVPSIELPEGKDLHHGFSRLVSAPKQVNLLFIAEFFVVFRFKWSYES